VVYDGLEECTEIEKRALGTVPDVLPNCRVPGLSYDEVRARAGFDTVAVLRRAFSARIPEGIAVTDDDLRAAFNRSGEGPSLEDLRRTVNDGYRFDERELRRLLEAGAPPDQRGVSWGRFERFRLRLRDGIRVTEADLRRAADRETLTALDRTRWWLGFARRALVALAAAEVILLVGISRLGGRSLESRIVWGGSALLVAGSAVAGVAVGVEALGGLTTPVIEGLRWGRGLTDKLLELRDELVATFSRPLVAQGMIVALAGLALVIWGIRSARGGDKPPVAG